MKKNNRLREKEEDRKNVLLHICCAVCASSVMERLKREGWEVLGYFYNPNIHPKEEYERRLKSTKFLLNELRVKLIEGEYEKEKWFEEVKGLQGEKEGGRRCDFCFRMRIKKTFEATRKIGVEYFTTTLKVSPHKKSSVIDRIGKEVGGDSFLAPDFKKGDSFKGALGLVQKYELYRQNYCGCLYSIPNNENF